MIGENIMTKAIILTGLFDPNNEEYYHAMFELEQLLAKGIQKVDIIVDSGGGYHTEFIELAKILDQFKQVNFYINKACSAAAMLLVHGDIRYINHRAMILFHTARYHTIPRPYDVDYNIQKPICYRLTYNAIKKKTWRKYPEVFNLRMVKQMIEPSFALALYYHRKAVSQGLITRQEYKEIIFKGKDIVVKPQTLIDRIKRC
jgi:ATP-dependent protease ClpP protease subunit